MQWHAQRHCAKGIEARQHAGNKTFHVGTAAPVVTPVTLGERKRRHAPGLPIDGNHVGVTRKHHPARPFWPQAGVEVRFAPVFVVKTLASNAAHGQKISNPVNQRQIGFPTGGIKRQQRGQNIARGIIHRPARRKMAHRAGPGRG